VYPSGRNPRTASCTLDGTRRETITSATPLRTLQRASDTPPTLSSPCPDAAVGDYGAEHSVKPVRSRARWRFPSQWWLRLGLASLWTPLRNQDNNAIEDRADARSRVETRLSSSRQVASHRCGIAIISSPSRGRAVGPKSRESGRSVGDRSGVCGEPRDDLSPARQHAPGPADRSAGRSSRRFLDPLF
jgi:hypothetical protein